MTKRKWIAGAIEHSDALTRKAKAAHMTLAAYEANPPKGISSTTRKQINLAKTLKGFRHK
jgi:hypothetical protein